MKKFKLTYDSILGYGTGETCLNINPPGTWFDRVNYVVFVGGCGVGEATSHVMARELLHKKALEYCDRRIEESKKILEHYNTQRSRLVNRGLTGEKKEEI
jgi:hypothetical protein